MHHSNTASENCVKVGGWWGFPSLVFVLLAPLSPMDSMAAAPATADDDEEEGEVEGKEKEARWGQREEVVISPTLGERQAKREARNEGTWGDCWGDALTFAAGSVSRAV